MLKFIEENSLARFWLPSLISGAAAWIAFIAVGDTPTVRATGLALVIIGVTAALRRMGAILSMAGGLTLAFSPAFWLQMGGGESEPATIVIGVSAAGIAALIAILMSRKPYIGIGLGVVIFVAIFWSQIGTPRSIRLTSLVTAWLMSILVDMLLITNPRPGDAPPERPRVFHLPGILLLFTIGLLNDPLLTLLSPAVILSLLLADARRSRWYWLLLIGAILIGFRGVVVDYLNAPTPLIIADGWRNADRWIDMVNLVTSQYTIAGVILGVLGLARLARWYPPLGSVTMIGYAAYIFFGLIYIGPNREILLLPLMIIQVTWMSYAAYTLNQWFANTIKPRGHQVPWYAHAIYLLVPLALYLQLMQDLPA